MVACSSGNSPRSLNFRPAHLDIAPRMTSAPSDELAKGAAGTLGAVLLHFIDDMETVIPKIDFLLRPTPIRVRLSPARPHRDAQTTRKRPASLL